jgi:CPA2 family monovalent cation:H+ antiporter-2
MGFSLLIHDLGFVIVTAFLVSVVFDKLRLPSIFGYLLAGILLGPYTFPDFSPISGRDSVQQLSELGIMFLMFSIGMEFDVERVKKVLFPSLIAVIVQTVVLIFLGLQVAHLLEWNPLQAIFLAAMMALSSTMVAVAVLKENKADQKISGNLAIGILVFEDILAILLLVVLSGMGGASDGSPQIMKILKVSGLIGIFVVCAYFLGRMIISRVIDLIPKKKIANYVTIFAFAELMAFSLLAESLHFSSALGAFLAGAILVQSKLFHEIEEATKPLRDIFTAIFFVSIGMMIDPGNMAKHMGLIVLLAVIKIFGTFVSCSTGLMLAGQKPRDSTDTAIVKSQLGEFAFVIAALGVSLKIFERDIISIVTGAAMISMLITPFLFNRRDNIYHFLVSKSPQYCRTLRAIHEKILEQILISFRNERWQVALPTFLKVGSYIFIFIGIILLATVLSTKMNSIVEATASTYNILTLSIWTGFLFVAIYPIRGIARNFVLLQTSILSTAQYQEKPQLENILNMVVTVAVSIILVFTYLMFASNFVSFWFIIFSVISLLAILLIFFRQHLLHADANMERAFVSSFHQKAEELNRLERNKRLREIEQKSKSQSVIREINIPENTVHAAKSIAELNIRKNFGVTILGTQRSGIIRFNPDPNSCIFPRDHLIVNGSEENIKRCAEFLTKEAENIYELQKQEISLALHRILLTDGHPFVGASLSALDLRKRQQISILYLIRNNEAVDHIDPEMPLEVNDAIYAIGNQQNIMEFGGTIVE